MQSRDDSLWESFPQAMKTHEGAGRYINAFRAPFQGLPPLSHQDVHVLRACSLLVIPPPTESMAPQGGFLTDLTGINLSDWAALVQDMAAGLQVLPPDLSSRLGLGVVNLLQLLEVATVGFCRFCCSLDPYCGCVGASQLAPPTLWSQILEQTLGYGVTTSSGGVTTPSTSMGGMPGYVAPPSGLTPPDFSIWSLPPLEASLPQGLPVSPRYLPPIGMATQMRAALDRQAQVPWAPAHQAQVLQAPAHQALVPHAPAPQASQMAPPICQPLPLPRGRPATPYQQAVQPPSKSTGLGVTFDSSANKPAPIGSQDANGCRRQSTQG